MKGFGDATEAGTKNYTNAGGRLLTNYNSIREMSVISLT